MLAATPFKEFKQTLLAAEQDAALANGSTAFQWSSKAVPHPAGGQVLVSLSSAQLYTSAGRIPRRVWFFVSAARGPFASNSAMAVTHVARTARIDFEKVMRKTLTNKLRLWASPMVLQP